MDDRYTPNYPDPEVESDKPNVSGMSPRANVEIEEAARRRVAEDPEWSLARKLNSAGGKYVRGDSRAVLEALGFEVLSEEGNLFYLVRPPEGWTKTTQGYWTSVKDKDGKERMTMFYKGAWYDQDAFLNING